MKTRKRMPAAVSGQERGEDVSRRCRLRKKSRIDYTTSEKGSGGLKQEHAAGDFVEEAEKSNGKDKQFKSAAPSNHGDEVKPDEQAAETGEKQTDVQNGGRRNVIYINSTVLQKKPKVILKKLQNIQVDCHLLLNNQTLQQNDLHIEETPRAGEELNEALYCSEDIEIYKAGMTSPHHIQNRNVYGEEITIVYPPTHLQSSAEDIPLDEKSPDPVELLLERPLQASSPCAITDYAAPTPQTSTDLDVMDLEHLKREKIKWQLKVLKLQEEYYTLQLKRLKQ